MFSETGQPYIIGALQKTSNSGTTVAWLPLGYYLLKNNLRIVDLQVCQIECLISSPSAIFWATHQRQKQAFTLVDNTFFLIGAFQFGFSTHLRELRSFPQ